MTLCISGYSVSSHEVTLENKTNEYLINTRMKNMSTINKLVQKIYKKFSSADFDFNNTLEYDYLKESALNIKHAAIDFKELFPPNSQGGKANNLIWEDKILFEEFNDNFLIDINLMIDSIDNKNIELLKKNFNNMSKNCGSCHKKFKNK